MESIKLATALTITMIVFMAFTSSGTMAQEFGAAPAPAPSMESVGMALQEDKQGCRKSVQISIEPNANMLEKALPTEDITQETQTRVVVLDRNSSKDRENDTPNKKSNNFKKFILLCCGNLVIKQRIVLQKGRRGSIGGNSNQANHVASQQNLLDN
ncbi:hypothetical protein CTI12_AA224020 [Artemisia annua]|uniref:Uncharacterized protein n=1 Tax=Artemisia annua TaxID=35608 RepID=A0A2U1NVV3_ARTAN|nr:hypothetical protein CTI12_AA224020 [Artemisia annua]